MRPAFVAFCLCMAGASWLDAAAAADRRERPSGTIRDLEDVEIQPPPDSSVAGSRREAMEQYRRFLQLESDNERLRAEAMRRLGDLQVQVDEAARVSGEMRLNGLELREAVALYEALLAAYPDYERSDAVLYQLARAYEAEGELEKSLAVLDRLVAAHPASPWAAESHFRRGEILFSAGRYREAESAYAAVVEAGPHSGFFEQSLYKFGWSLYKQGRGEQSVAAFLRLLDGMLLAAEGVRERESLTRAERELIDDALRITAITFADLEGPESLDAMLARRGDPAYVHLLYGALGDLYIEKERWQDAALAYEAFARRRPDDRHAPSMQMRAIEAYRQGGFASLVLEGKQAFVERYAFGSAFWRDRTVADAPEAAAQLKANQKDLAEHHHAQAQSTKQAGDYAAAARWRRAMLDSFPQDQEASRTNYLLAEVLFESGRYAEAAREYERTAYDYPLHAQSAAAGYAALVAYQRHEAAIGGEARELWRRQGVESALMFAHSFAEHPQSGRVLTRADEDLFALGELDRVIEVSTQILERSPPVERQHQRTAATLLAHALFDRGRHQEAESAYLRVQGFLSAEDPERAAVEERIAASIYRQAEAKQSQGDLPGAIEDFLRVGARAPNAAVRANAEFDAASLLVQSGEWGRAAQVLEAFRSRFPGHELAPEATRTLAAAYLELGRAGQAAGEFERVAAQEDEPTEVRRAALWQAAELYEQSASPTNAERVYADYVGRFPTPLDAAMDARQKLAQMAQARNDAQARAHWNAEIIRADREAGAARTDRSRYLAALATLESAEPQAAVFKAVRLTAPLERTLQMKRSAMEKALSIYGEALDYGVAEATTAATFAMAEFVSSVRCGPDRLGAPAGSGRGNSGTVRSATGGAGVPVRREGHRAARSQCAARQRRPVRRMGAAQLRCAGDSEAGALCEDRVERGLCARTALSSGCCAPRAPSPSRAC
jgi:cellulose synthase operon protein C